MGYQALLFSPDEKLGRIVSQVFTELDFTVEPTHEPFGAVKKLMAQHFDAIVVDCTNEQNAALLFKSARNSSFNQSSLAIAVVEGQAGIAKAYRIGANLVLTKPINVEQSKGTIRVARGLLRKSSDAAGGSATSVADSSAPTGARPVTSAGSFQATSRGPAAFTPPQSRPDLLEFETPHPATSPDAFPQRTSAGFPAAVSAKTSSAKIEATPVSAAQIRITMADEPGVRVPQSASPGTIKNPAIQSNTARSEPARNEPARIASASRSTQNSGGFPASGSGAAPARAMEVTPPAKENEKDEWKPANASQDDALMLTPDPAIESAPLFSAFGEEESRASGGKKKILIALILLTLAALGYIGYGKLDKSSTATLAPPPVSTPQQPVQQNTGQPVPAPVPVPEPEPVRAPMSSSETVPSTTTSDAADSAAGLPAPKLSAPKPSAPKTIAAKLPGQPSPAVGNPSIIRIALNPGAGTKNPDPAPLLVKSNPAEIKTRTPSAESASALPNPPAIASANENALSSLMSPALPALPKPSLTTNRISQGVSQGLLIRRVQPIYPRAALETHAHGAVQIEATIDKEGKVTNLKVLSGDPILAHAAADAVRQWRYKPYYLDGEPVEIQTQITVNFKED